MDGFPQVPGDEGGHDVALDHLALDQVALGGEALGGEASGAGLEADLGTLAAIESELDEVEHALRRLDDGSYGRCEACGAPLGEAVLVDVPTARFCGAHVPMAPGQSLP